MSLEKWKEQAIKASATEVEEKAEEYFRNGGYHCAESMMLAFSEVLDVPVDLRYVSGFGGGLGETRCVCGAFNGAGVMLNLLLGPDKQAAGPRGGGRNLEKQNKLDKSIQDLQKKFKDEYKVTCCKVITRNVWGTPDQLEHCVQLTGETAKMLLEVIQDVAKEESWR